MKNKIKSPFKFLDSYSKEDKTVFFGRDEEIDELYSRIFRSKILLLFGNSGVGKTSLIRCGLANRFYESDWFPVYVRRGSNICKSLKNELSKFIDAPDSITDSESVSDIIQSIYLENFKPVYIIFDQFEEIFIFGNKTERTEFISTIKQVISSKLQCKFIFSIREEYFGKLTEFENEIPDFLYNRSRINPITRHNAQIVIEKSCAAYNIFLESGCSDLILTKLFPNEIEIDLAYLQIFLDQIYQLSYLEINSNNISFTKELILKAGDVKDVLGSFLDDELSQFESTELATEILKSFISAKGTKQQVTEEDIFEDVRSVVEGIEIGKVHGLLESLVSIRILRDKDENGKYELRHDSLAVKINEKIALPEKELKEIRRLIKTALEKYQKRKILIGFEDLTEIEPYINKLFLNQDEKELINLSRKALGEKKRKKRNIVIYSLSLFIFSLSCFTIWALLERREAKNAARIAMSNETASFSLLNLDKDPTVSFRLAEKAFQTFRSPLAMEALSLAYETSAYSPFYNDLKGHTKDIYCMDFTSFGNNIVTGSFDSTARVWDLSGKELFVLSGHKGRIFSVKFSSNGSYILTSSEDSTVRIWNREGKLLTIIKDPAEANYLADFSPDNKNIVTASKSGVGSIWQLSGPEMKFKKHCILTGHQGPINSIHFSGDMKYIATTSRDKTAMIWDYSGKNIAVLTGHDGIVRDISFSTDNTRLLTSSDDNTARIWSINGVLLKILSGHTGGITRSDYTPDGKFIVCISDDGTASKWDINGQLLNVLKAQIGSINRLAISPDSKFIGLGGDNGISEIWSIEGMLLYSLKRHSSSIRELKFAMNNLKVISTSIDATAKVWTLNNEDLETYNQMIAQTIWASVTHASTEMIVLNNKGSLSLYYPLLDTLLDFNYQSPAISACFSSDNSIILTSSYDNTARIWSRNGQELLKIIHPNAVKSIEFSPDEKFILTSCNDGTTRIWNRNGELIKEFRKDIDLLNCATYSPDGRKIIVGSTNSQVTIWNVNEGTIIQTLTGHKAEITKAQYAPDGSYLLTTSKDGDGILWNPNGMIIKRIQNTHRTAIEEIGFSYNSEYFFTLSKKPYLIQIRDRKGELMNAINLGDNMGREHYAQFSEDGKFLLVITNNENRIQIKKWPLFSEELIKYINHRKVLGDVRQLSDDERNEFYLDN